jgi:hypothetical protein
MTLAVPDMIKILAKKKRRPPQLPLGLNELIRAGYVFRIDERVDGQAAYAVNRDLLPEIITEVSGAEV